MALPHGDKADVYSWALLAWSVASGRTPFEGLGRSAFYSRVVVSFTSCCLVCFRHLKQEVANISFATRTSFRVLGCFCSVYSKSKREKCMPPINVGLVLSHLFSRFPACLWS